MNDVEDAYDTQSEDPIETPDTYSPRSKRTMKTGNKDKSPVRARKRYVTFKD